MMGVFVQFAADTYTTKSGRVRRNGRASYTGWIVCESGCWEWVGAESGWYGPHRRVYEQMRGPIPAHLELDHLCRNRRCVNPDHLEIVPGKVNILRGESPPADNARKDCCVQGHPFDNKNTRLDQRGKRVCRRCRVLHTDRYRQKNPTKRHRKADGPRSESARHAANARWHPALLGDGLGSPREGRNNE